MKNACLKLAAVAGLVAATTAFADNAAQMKGYFSTKTPSLVSDSAKPNRFPPTDITVTNASAYSIHVVVPGTTIHDTLYATDVDHIRNYSGAFYTTITLEDSYHAVFWNQMVCPRALITVYGQPGYYRIINDTEYCS